MNENVPALGSFSTQSNPFEHGSLQRKFPATRLIGENV
jgi:hypothetical protein